MGNSYQKLQERLIDFTISCLEIAEKLPNNYIGDYFSKQLVRSASSVSLLYGEAREAESRKDFIHKIKLVVKELRESLITLTIIYKKAFASTQELNEILKECDELISIFVVSLKTARNKNKPHK